MTAKPVKYIVPRIYDWNTKTGRFVKQMNLADIRDREMLSCMEEEYTSIRLAELVIGESASRFDFASLCDMHYYIFQDIYEWAGKIRIINIEKTELALGGISTEYSECFDIERDAKRYKTASL